MKFKIMRIYFLSEFLVFCHPKILLPWRRDVTTSPLHGVVKNLQFRPLSLRVMLEF